MGVPQADSKDLLQHDDHVRAGTRAGRGLAVSKHSGCMATSRNFKAQWGDVMGSLHDNLGTLGYIIIAMFALNWLASVVIYKVKHFDKRSTDDNVRCSSSSNLAGRSTGPEARTT
jgi:hypothetical protein